MSFIRKSLRTKRVAAASTPKPEKKTGKTGHARAGGTMSTAESRIHIVGVGSDGLAGLTGRARELLAAAELRARLRRTRWACCPSCTAERVPHRLRPARGRPDARSRTSARKRMVVVASGDPLFYGVARYLCDRLGKDRFEVLPHVSSMQLAFARVKETLGGGVPDQPGDAPAGRRARPHPHRRDRRPVHQRAGRPARRSPAQLLARGLDYFRAYVCENLGGPDERVTQGELAEIADDGVRPAQRA